MGHINNRVYASSPFFFIHPPRFPSNFMILVPLPTCVSSHEKKKKEKKYHPKLFLFFILEQTRVSLRIHSSAKINFNADPEITLPHSFTVTERDDRSLSLVFLFPLIVHRPRCSTRVELYRRTYRFFASIPLPNAP